MDEVQERRLRRYQEDWARLNAVNALIADLEKERDLIKARQRQTANAMVRAMLPAEDPSVLPGQHQDQSALRLGYASDESGAAT